MGESDFRVRKGLIVADDVTFEGTNLDIAAYLRHLGDTNTYLQFGTDTISLVTDGTTRLQIPDDGAITVSNTLHTTQGLSSSVNVSIGDSVVHIGDVTNKISFGTATQSFITNGATRMDISNSGMRLGGANIRVTTILNEDDMSTDSDTALATQQSIKAYIDDSVGSAGGGDITAVTAGDGLTGGATSGGATLTVGAGTGIDVATDAVSVDMSELIDNAGNDRILTAKSASSVDVNAETDLTYSGYTLTLHGSSGPNVPKILFDDSYDTAITNGDAIGLLQFRASNESSGGYSDNVVGNIRISAGEAFDATNNKAEFIIELSNDSAAAAERFRVSGTGDVTSTGTVTAAGFTTTGTWTFDESDSGTVAIATVQDSGSAFNNVDTELMTSAAIEDKILAYSYTSTGATTANVVSALNADLGGDIVFGTQTDDEVRFGGDISGRSVNGEYSSLLRMGGIHFTWDSDTYGTGSNTNHCIISTENGTYTDSLTINSYDKIRLNMDTNSNNSDSYIQFGRHDTGTGGDIFMTIADAGNVGIGTADPQSPLHVVGNVMIANTDSDDTTKDSRILSRTYSNNDYNLLYGYANSTTNRLYIGGGTSTGEPASHIYFYTGAKSEGTDATGSKHMEIEPGGDIVIYTKLGINDSNPDAELHVDGSVLISAYDEGAGAGLFFREGFLNTNQPSITVQDHSGANPDGLAISAYDGISFRLDATEKARFDSSGNLGIGTSSPSAKLDVDEVADGIGLRVRRNDSSTSVPLVKFIDDSTGNDGPSVLEIQNDVTNGLQPSLMISGGSISLKEQADAPGDTAGYGQLWVNTATPNELYFTTDAGDDVQITSGTSIAGGGGGGGISNVVEDTSPQLGADLDTNSHHIKFDDAHGILDSAGAETLIFQEVGSAADYLQIYNATNDTATTGTEIYSGPLLEATGSSTHVGMRFQTKGRGSFTFFNEMDDNNHGPTLNLWRKNAGEADEDAIGQIRFQAQDSSPASTEEYEDARDYVKLKAYITDASNNSADGRLDINCLINDSQATMAQFGTHAENDQDGGAALIRAQILTRTGTSNALSGISDAGRYILCGSSSAACTLQLQASPAVGEQYVFISNTTGTVTVQANGSDTINGSTNDVTITTKYNALTLIALSASAWVALG